MSNLSSKYFIQLLIFLILFVIGFYLAFTDFLVGSHEQGHLDRALQEGKKAEIIDRDTTRVWGGVTWRIAMAGYAQQAKIGFAVSVGLLFLSYFTNNWWFMGASMGYTHGLMFSPITSTDFLYIVDAGENPFLWWFLVLGTVNAALWIFMVLMHLGRWRE